MYYIVCLFNSTFLCIVFPNFTMILCACQMSLTPTRNMHRTGYSDWYMKFYQLVQQLSSLINMKFKCCEVWQVVYTTIATCRLSKCRTSGLCQDMTFDISCERTKAIEIWHQLIRLHATAGCPMFVDLLAC